MNYITPEQFEKHFTVNGKTLAVTPSASLCARSLGHSVDYLSDSSEKFSYDTVIVDIVEGLKFEGYKARHQYMWLKTSIEYSRHGGNVYVKAPVTILNQVNRLCYKVFTKSLIVENDNIYLHIISKKSNNEKTFVQYATGEKIDFDIKKSLLPQRYNQKHLDYINLVEENDTKIEYDDSVCVGGKQRDMFEKIYKKSLKEKTYGLLIQNNTKKLQISKLEDQSCNSSADVYLFSSEKQRDRYFDKLNTCDIIKLADNLACGGEINKKVQSYLMSPFIFDYAI